MSGAGYILAIETSQRQGEVALASAAEARSAENRWISEQLQSGDRHSDDLMPAIQRLCQRADVQPRDLAAVAVSIGPGAFSGLRIAVATAKMIALATSARVIGIPSARVAAASTSLPPPSDSAADEADGSSIAPGVSAGAIAVALACKQNSCWLTRLAQRTTNDGCRAWQIIGEPTVVDATEFDPTGIDCLLADDFLPQAMRARCEQAAISIQPFLMHAAMCGRLAASDMMIADSRDDRLTLEPLYARPPEAVRLWAQRSGAAGKCR